MSRSRAIVVLLALLLALPSYALGQGAGDEQYQDPFGDEQAQGNGNGADGRAAQDDGGLTDEPPVEDGGNGGNGDNGGDQGDGGDTGDPGGETEAEDPAPADDGKSLPNTGSEPLLLAYVGLLFLLVGAGLRLRTADPDDF